jgi:hypothetical protein
MSPHNQHKQSDQPSAGRCCGRYVAKVMKSKAAKIGILVVLFVSTPVFAGDEDLGPKFNASGGDWIHLSPGHTSAVTAAIRAHEDWRSKEKEPADLSKKSESIYARVLPDGMYEVTFMSSSMYVLDSGVHYVIDPVEFKIKCQYFDPKPRCEY